MLAGQSKGSDRRQAELRFSSTMRSGPSLRISFAGVDGKSCVWLTAAG
jgi:hypothetical protein